MNGIDRYLRAVRRHFPFVSRRERVYLKRLRGEVADCFDGKAPGSVEEVSARFGAPKEVAEGYLDSLEPDYVLLRARVRNRWRRAAVCAAALFAAACVLFVAAVGREYAIYREAQKTAIGYAVETIGEPTEIETTETTDEETK